MWKQNFQQINSFLELISTAEIDYFNEYPDTGLPVHAFHEFFFDRFPWVRLRLDYAL